jgi:hypothetical protein
VCDLSYCGTAGGRYRPASHRSRQRQLEELKQQYVETTRSLEQRIAALEQQIEKSKEAAAAPKQGTVLVAQLAEESVFRDCRDRREYRQYRRRQNRSRVPPGLT